MPPIRRRCRPGWWGCQSPRGRSADSWTAYAVLRQDIEEWKAAFGHWADGLGPSDNLSTINQGLADHLKQARGLYRRCNDDADLLNELFSAANDNIYEVVRSDIGRKILDSVDGLLTAIREGLSAEPHGTWQRYYRWARIARAFCGRVLAGDEPLLSNGDSFVAEFNDRGMAQLGGRQEELRAAIADMSRVGKNARLAQAVSCFHVLQALPRTFISSAEQGQGDSQLSAAFRELAKDLLRQFCTLSFGPMIDELNERVSEDAPPDSLSRRSTRDDSRPKGLAIRQAIKYLRDLKDMLTRWADEYSAAIELTSRVVRQAAADGIEDVLDPAQTDSWRELHADSIKEDVVPKIEGQMKAINQSVAAALKGELKGLPEDDRGLIPELNQQLASFDIDRYGIGAQTESYAEVRSLVASILAKLAKERGRKQVRRTLIELFSDLLRKEPKPVVEFLSRLVKYVGIICIVVLALAVLVFCGEAVFGKIVDLIQALK